VCARAGCVCVCMCECAYVYVRVCFCVCLYVCVRTELARNFVFMHNVISGHDVNRVEADHELIQVASAAFEKRPSNFAAPIHQGSDVYMYIYVYMNICTQTRT